MSEFDNVINEINKKNEAKETVEQTVELDRYYKQVKQLITISITASLF